MTRDDAIKIFNTVLCLGKCDCSKDEIEECLKMAIEALKQQPNEDCISRKAVLEGLKSIAKAKSKSDAQKSLMGRVMFFAEHLPSVTPQPKEHTEERTETHECDCISRKGYWIEHKRGEIEHIECSECHVWFLKVDLIRKSYCPNCGSCNGDMIKNIMRDITKQ